MKFIKRRPCKECPFLKTSVKGWLGPDTAGQVMQKVHDEGGYVCHVSIADGQQKRAQQCVGAVLHATKTFKVYVQPQLRALQQKLRDQDTSGILNYQEFYDWHKESFIEMLDKKKRGLK